MLHGMPNLLINPYGDINHISCVLVRLLAEMMCACGAVTLAVKLVQCST
jgi:hypothetical protein